MTKKTTILAIVITSMVMLSACSNKEKEPVKATVTNINTEIDQTDVCIAMDTSLPNAAKTCKPGHKIVFRPMSWGNEQMPLIFVSFFCDLRYSVAMNNGGVVCIYNPIKSIDQVSVTK